jgi:hypothetical protein
MRKRSRHCQEAGPVSDAEFQVRERFIPAQNVSRVIVQGKSVRYGDAGLSSIVQSLVGESPSRFAAMIID